MLQAKRLLALDVGSKRIGVAVSDHAGMFAHPLLTLDAQGPTRDAARVAELCRTEEAGGVVLGLPAHADGTESTSARRSRKLGEALRQLGVEIDYIDEWGSSLDAHEALRHTGGKHRKDKGLVDQAAAVSILQGYLRARAEAHPTGDTPPGDDA